MSPVRLAALCVLHGALAGAERAVAHLAQGVGGGLTVLAEEVLVRARAGQVAQRAARPQEAKAACNCVFCQPQPQARPGSN